MAVRSWRRCRGVDVQRALWRLKARLREVNEKIRRYESEIESAPRPPAADVLAEG